MDLVTIFYMWFPCCSCLGRVIQRTNSASTQESIIFRRSFLRRSINGNTSTKRTVLTSRRLTGYHPRNCVINQTIYDDRNQDKEKIGKSDNINTSHIEESLRMVGLGISEMEKATVINRSDTSDSL